MAGSITEMEKSESNSQDSQFVWDENSKLYFHASSGFYHDPNAGWYYSTRDGLYYKFENGDYVLLNSDQSDKCETSEMESDVPESSSRDEQCAKVAASKDEIGNAEFTNSYSPENHRPPSEWLEETLIDLYLSGYTTQAIDKVGGDATSPKKTDEVDNIEFQPNEDTDAYELEEGEWIPEDDFDADQSNEDTLDDGFAREEEENWRSQFGQVVRSSEEEEEGKIDIPAVELWDWSTVKGTRKNGKGEITKLVGRLMRNSAKLHPSMPCGGVRLKTAPICEVRLDLVRVTTGQVYRLRNPSAELLASLSAYDSSDPTKDWGFPELSIHEAKQSVNNPSSHNPKTDAKAGGKNSAIAREKNKSQTYRDRAAERRALHGAFSVAPGQDTREEKDEGESSFRSAEAAAQALDMSFGAGSYARKLLEGMGWKQGEALGKSAKGLVEPILAEGNIGSAGLGWPRGRSKHPLNF